MKKQTFAEHLPDLTQSPVPYPNPKDAGEVCANRLAARKSGAIKHHYFPLTAPDQAGWTALLERVALLENENTHQAARIEMLEGEVKIMARGIADLRYKGQDE